MNVSLANGITNQAAKLRNNVKTGEKKKINLFDSKGKTVSFVINFKASANGCNKPKKPTILGPLLLCIKAIILRSNKVKNATEISTGIKITKDFKINNSNIK